ncbi:MAG: NADH-quinone oxidoreductase subunit NuoF [bacterium]
MPEETRVLLNNISEKYSGSFAEYKKGSGYKGLKKALTAMTPEQVRTAVKDSNLRGRGGAGFPAGMKWNFCAADKTDPKYLICNADEGEPGTFKDRVILEQDPHKLLEGMAIAGYSFGARYGYIYLRAEYPYAKRVLEEAIEQAYRENVLGENILNSGFSFDLKVFRGAGAYICGEETALLDSMEGKIGRSRIKPPFPVNKGLFQKPTVINNVETLAYVPQIVVNGADWFKGYGPAESPGTKLFGVSGHVSKPGIYELPMGISVRELIYDYAGGIRNGNQLKALLPGGASCAALTTSHIGTQMDFHNLPKVGSMLGSGACIVIDHTTCMVGVAHNLLKFYVHESCGRCTPCRDGNGWITRMLMRIKNCEAEPVELEIIEDMAGNMGLSGYCPLGMAASGALLSFLKFFRSEFEAHINDRKCPFGQCKPRNTDHHH